jgi:hypothetical protein
VSLSENIFATLQTGDARALRHWLLVSSSVAVGFDGAVPDTGSTRKNFAAAALALCIAPQVVAGSGDGVGAGAKLRAICQSHAAFAADTTLELLDVAHAGADGNSVFALARTAAPATPPSPFAMQRNRVVCLVNVSASEQLVSLDWRTLLGTRNAIRDLVSGIRFNVHGPSLSLQPYQVLWATV